MLINISSDFCGKTYKRRGWLLKYMHDKHQHPLQTHTQTQTCGSQITKSNVVQTKYKYKCDKVFNYKTVFKNI